jgi:protein-tyrosine-phosphatase
MAGAIARRVATERGLTELEIGSAGIAAWNGAPASDGAMLVALERDEDLSSHRSRPLTAELVRDADLVLAMGAQHLERIEALGGRGKAWLLTDYASRGDAPRSVADPFGGDLATYRQTYDELEREIRLAFDRIAAERTPDRS